MPIAIPQSRIRIKEADGSPTNRFHTLILPNGTLADNADGTATYTPSGGGASSVIVQELDSSPSVTATEIQVPRGTLTDNGSGVCTLDPTVINPLTLNNLGLWLTADDLGLSDTDPIGTISDKSGNARDYTQATAGKKPLFKTAIQNGLGVARFDGVDDYMNYASIYNPSGRLTVFFVGKFSAGNPLSSAKIPSTSGGFTISVNASKFLMQSDDGSTSWPTLSFNSGLFDSTHFLVWTIQFGIVARVRVQGVQYYASTINDSRQTLAVGDTTYGLLIGALNNTGTLGGFAALDFGELIAVERTCTDMEIAGIENYLYKKWALIAG